MKVLFFFMWIDIMEIRLDYVNGIKRSFVRKKITKVLMWVSRNNKKKTKEKRKMENQKFGTMSMIHILKIAKV